MSSTNITTLALPDSKGEFASPLDGALFMASLGIPQIPLQEKGKNPIQGLSWKGIETCDPEQIVRWSRQYPNCNFGSVAKNGSFWVLDCDTKEVANRKKQQTNAGFTRTLTIESSKGGHRWYIATPESAAMGNMDSDDANGKEEFSCRVHLKYTVTCGSVHPSGKQYRVAINTAPVGMPDDEIAWLMKQSGKSSAALTVADSKPLAKDAAEYLEFLSTYSETIHESGRNKRLFKLACDGHKHYGLSFNDLYSVILDINDNCCAPPLHKSEVETTVRSATGYDSIAEQREKETPTIGGVKAGTSVVVAAKVPDPALQISIKKASEVKPKRQEWFWKNRFPANALNGLSGEPDKGKTFISIDLVARATVGAAFPDGAANPFGKPVEALMFIAEDSLESTIVPRLIRAGADLTKIHFLESVILQNEKRELALTTDMPLIRKKLEEHPEIRLLAIDTITSYLGDTDNYSDPKMRKILIPLRKMAEDLKVTIIALAHFNKNTTASAMNRTGGTIAMTAVPRASYCCVADPENKDRFLFLTQKGNLGKKLKGLSYTIEGALISVGGELDDVGKVVWGADSELDADDALTKAADPQEKLTVKAEKFLKDYLADGKPHASEHVFDDARVAGIGEWSVKAARKRIHVESRKVSLRWYMRLPNEHNEHGKAPWILVTVSAESDGSPVDLE